VFLGITEFEYKDLFTSVYAVEKDIFTDSITLSNYKTNTSIEIRKGMPVKINKKRPLYTFVSYDINTSDINLINKKGAVVSLDLNNIAYISIQVDNLSKDNVLGGLAGGLVGAATGVYPSALAGWAVGMAMGSLNNESQVPVIACLGITAAGTALSAQTGYNLGKNAGSPYVHIPLSGEDSWRISID
tara:strand:- start:7386 stop:7946 length:561 start_codon:yes stop_codon:yes gene_type:complete